MTAKKDSPLQEASKTSLQILQELSDSLVRHQKQLTALQKRWDKLGKRISRLKERIG